MVVWSRKGCERRVLLAFCHHHGPLRSTNAISVSPAPSERVSQPHDFLDAYLVLTSPSASSQQSISRVVSFAIKHFPQCGEDVWDCIVEECQKVLVYISLCFASLTLEQGSLNARINIFYFLDSLCETCLSLQSSGRSDQSSIMYMDFVERDLEKVVDSVVPPGKEGMVNLGSARQVCRSRLIPCHMRTHTISQQILENWRSKRFVKPDLIDNVLGVLSQRTTDLRSNPDHRSAEPLPRHEIFKRIEEDRERHKRLRERRWVQAVSHQSNTVRPSLLSLKSPSASEENEEDIEFENDWETTSEWNNDDEEACAEENEFCFLNLRSDNSIAAMDIS